MSRRGHKYTAQVLALGATETLTLPDGTPTGVARKPWAIPEHLGPGDWFVSWKEPRLAGVSGNVVPVAGGPPITIPGDVTAVDVPDTDFAPL